MEARFSIGVIHSSYRSSEVSGENNTVEDIREILKAISLDAEYYNSSTDGILQSKVRLALEAIRHLIPFGIPSKDFREFVKRNSVFQLHNSFPILSPVRINYLLRSGKPITRVLHNYRASCLVGTNYRKGASCTLCSPSKGYVAGVFLGCYNNSKLMSAVVSAHTRGIVRLMHSPSARLVAVTDFVAKKHVEMGFSAAKISVIHNSVNVSSIQAKKGGGCLFLGRLSVEKGAKLILDAWKADLSLPKLFVAGSGPLSSSFKELSESDPRVRFYGQLTQQQTEEVWAETDILLCPSIWEEPFGRVAAEGLARGHLIATTGSGGLKEIVEGLEILRLLKPNEKDVISEVKRLADLSSIDMQSEMKRHFEMNFSRSAVKSMWLQHYLNSEYVISRSDV
jgi:glycosyltransferase involved in cell wall biosynthesis